MPADFLLGLDAGQTVTKACVFDRAGHALGIGAGRVGLSSPRPHWVERDMEEVWRAAAGAIRAALADAGVAGDRIAAVGLVGHNDGLYLLTEDGKPVRPAVTAMDTRAHDVVAAWRETPRWDQALALTGQVPYTGSPSTLLAWFRRHEPEVLQRTRWILFCKDWLRYRLTHRIATDPTEASCAFTDVRTQDYSDAVWELYDLPPLSDRLPALRRPDELAGEVVPEAAEATGLAVGTPVVTGAHDVDGAALGSGAVAPGQLSLLAGTFSINQVVGEDVRLDPGWQSRSFLRPGTWLNMSTSASSASNLEWWRELFDLPPDPASYAVLDAEVARTLDEPSRVLYHPFLYGAPYGEAAEAGLLGLRGWHGRADVVRALYEGVVFSHHVHVDRLRTRFAFTGPARLAGGATRSTVWSQMFADGLDMTVEVPATEETGALGAALLAGLGLGWYSSLDDAAASVEIARVHEPDPRRARMLAEAYERFVAAADALHPLWEG